MRHCKEITAALWKRIKPLLSERKLSSKGGRPRLDDELALNGIVFVLRTGIPWEDLPQELGYGSGMSCWSRLKQWQVCAVSGTACIVCCSKSCATQIVWI
ncbi:hypothetical protein GCM10009425_48970 [Pseudomonas asuensis]|uniref:Insertion element IS402-like domain-containing protein n=1 Tax=Pseudomonas asuensis TaxID=1825787 RepID=A0ABQ2H621_9PSED|nr:hypothetical protein GCM10009425_48970 [Pseudomonas asuensis]